MLVVTKIKPVEMTGKTLDELKRAIMSRFGLVYMAAGNCHGYREIEVGRHRMREKHWYGINFEKRRKKRGKYANHWVAFVYQIPLGCGVDQMNRRFRLLVDTDCQYAIHRPTFKLQ